MAVLTGKQYTVSIGAADYSGVITTGTIDRSGSSETIQTLAGKETVSQGVEDTMSADFLYDGGAGFYAAAWAAAGSGATVAVVVVGGDGTWTGDMIITSVSDEFPADGASTCSVELAGELAFAAVGP